MDLAEPSPFNPSIQGTPGNNVLPSNDVNDLYRKIINDPTSRKPVEHHQQVIVARIAPGTGF
jgi:hypothetical protein